MPLDIPMVVCLTSHTEPFWHEMGTRFTGISEVRIEPLNQGYGECSGWWADGAPSNFFWGGRLGPSSQAVTLEDIKKESWGGKKMTRLLLLWQLTGIWNSRHQHLDVTWCESAFFPVENHGKFLQNVDIILRARINGWPSQLPPPELSRIQWGCNKGRVMKIPIP